MQTTFEEAFSQHRYYLTKTGTLERKFHVARVPNHHQQQILLKADLCKAQGQHPVLECLRLTPSSPLCKYFMMVGTQGPLRFWIPRSIYDAACNLTNDDFQSQDMWHATVAMFPIANVIKFGFSVAEFFSEVPCNRRNSELEPNDCRASLGQSAGYDRALNIF